MYAYAHGRKINHTAQKMKFYINNFFSKCNQIRKLCNCGTTDFQLVIITDILDSS